MHSSDNSANNSVVNLVGKKHRHCFILKGSTTEVLSDFLQLSEHFSTPLICAYDVSAYDDFLSKSKSFTTRTFKQVRQELGSTHDAVLVDLTQGISASALAILSGTIRGNGLFAIALPKGDWLSFADQDLARYLPWPYEPEQIDSSFKRFFLNHLESPNSPFQSINRKEIVALPALIPVEKGTYLTKEQTNVQARVLDQQAESYVLIAPRGRGKSTLLGDSIAKLLLAGKRVAVTAPNKEAITALKFRFEQAFQPNQDLPFFAPDALLADNTHWDYLFVDEASMIPVPLLIALNQKASHCVFSTTDYGYEGAGKGFGIRFCRYLKQHNTSLKELSLQQPIRWGENDPLENWINDSFFLGAVDQIAASNNASTSFEYQHITGKEWLKKPELLANTFQLLVSAHYQTSPDNLRWVLDDPSVSTFLSLQGNILNSVAVITKEGELPDKLCLEVMQGTRRPRGHLVPQSLLAHEGIEDAGQYSYWRISRIATTQSEQNKGLASQLVNHIEQAAIGKYDFLCTSFAATSDVISFWLKNEFIPVRLGTGKDQASGCYSLMMVKPLHAKAHETASLWHQYYLANLSLNLLRDYQDIPNDLVIKLNSSMKTENLATEELRQKDQRDLSLFVHHHRPYLTIRAQLTRLTKNLMANNQLAATHPEFTLLNTIITQPHNNIDFASFGLKSKKQMEKHLKKVVGELLECLYAK
ncbi:hypothetical protein MUS1_04285 [Marinomonas ushuaiensis DSM 15871]|uniref:tRNA(Met) cytidine acetyltransferase TmcA n=1 Tax=Marinomonas ushuaiensis DSM 15871 TaxID=1122207 RepID=X7E1W1_9GAMM|nr:GNAT family N-acetyltransferase [Marinomonas ushuaiensis]ETX10054.1 hypothetical protein MUS1_04285 [Marinomonas ushuaiensis DSM 15871]